MRSDKRNPVGRRHQHWLIQREWIRSLRFGDLPNTVRINGDLHTDTGLYLSGLQKSVKASRTYNKELDEQINQLQRAVVWNTKNLKDY